MVSWTCVSSYWDWLGSVRIGPCEIAVVSGFLLTVNLHIQDGSGRAELKFSQGSFWLGSRILVCL